MSSTSLKRVLQFLVNRTYERLPIRLVQAVIIIIISFIGFGSQEGWITTDIKKYITNSKTVSTHQLSDESQSVIKFSPASQFSQSIKQAKCGDILFGST